MCIDRENLSVELLLAPFHFQVNNARIDSKRDSQIMQERISSAEWF